MIFGRTTLRKLFGPVIEDDQWRLRTNVELEKLYKYVNIGTFIKLQRLRWMGHLQGMDDARNNKKNTKPTYTKNDLRGDPKLDGKMM
jgi:hypothetical protein